uniref:Uncharacterized protein n=1 Tax=Cannabis sativa TaxID=3483 RepID=A0A803QV02_CANSA
MEHVNNHFMRTNPILVQKFPFYVKTISIFTIHTSAMRTKYIVAIIKILIIENHSYNYKYSYDSKNISGKKTTLLLVKNFWQEY